MDAPLRRHLLADQAAALLESRIAAAEWHVGEKLPGETTLAAELGVGRSTVREAVRMLAGAGMLESRQGSGVFLTAVTPQADWDRTVRTEHIRHVVEVRNTVEAEAAALAARRRNSEDIRVLRGALDARSVAASVDAQAFVDADLELHRAVVAAAHNPVLTELFDTFVPRLRTAMLDVMDVLELSAQDEPDRGGHGDLVEAIVNGDPQEAERISVEHLARMAASLNRAEVNS